jgi:hypothetical protein
MQAVPVVKTERGFLVCDVSRRMFALGHVWTAPWQELSDVSAALVWCGHVSGRAGMAARNQA